MGRIDRIKSNCGFRNSGIEELIKTEGFLCLKPKTFFKHQHKIPNAENHTFTWMDRIDRIRSNCEFRN
jgi:hypothetical protein